MKNMKKKTLLICLLTSYIVLLGYVLFFRSLGATYQWTYTEYLNVMHNFIPLKSVYILLTTPVISMRVLIRFAVNFVGNIVLFLPWGVLLPALFNKLRLFKPFFVLTLFVLVLVETIQIFAMLGSFDVEDILLNVSGTCIGFACYKKWSKQKTDI